MNIDQALACVALITYAVVVLSVLPAETYPLMLGGAAVLVGVALLADRVWGSRPTHGSSLMGVSFLSLAVLAVPNFPAMGGEHREAAAVGFFGSQALALLWLSLRWSPWRVQPRVSLSRCLGIGLLGAVGLSVIATVPLLLVALSGAEGLSRLLWVYPAYLGGSLTAALTYWGLQSVAHRPVGRYVIGATAGLCLYLSMAPVVAVVRPEARDVSVMLTIGTIAGLLVGPPVAVESIEERDPLGAGK